MQGESRFISKEAQRKSMAVCCLPGCRTQFIALDDWQVGPFDGDARLKLETVRVRKRNVKDEAVRNKRSCASLSSFEMRR
jgi:hypothetical protein